MDNKWVGMFKNLEDVIVRLKPEKERLRYGDNADENYNSKHIPVSITKRTTALTLEEILSRSVQELYIGEVMALYASDKFNALTDDKDRLQREVDFEILYRLHKIIKAKEFRSVFVGTQRNELDGQFEVVQNSTEAKTLKAIPGWNNLAALFIRVQANMKTAHTNIIANASTLINTSVVLNTTMPTAYNDPQSAAINTPLILSNPIPIATRPVANTPAQTIRAKAPSITISPSIIEPTYNQPLFVDVELDAETEERAGWAEEDRFHPQFGYSHDALRAFLEVTSIYGERKFNKLRNTAIVTDDVDSSPRMLVCNHTEAEITVGDLIALYSSNEFMSHAGKFTLKSLVIIKRDLKLLFLIYGLATTNDDREAILELTLGDFKRNIVTVTELEQMLQAKNSDKNRVALAEYISRRAPGQAVSLKTIRFWDNALDLIKQDLNFYPLNVQSPSAIDQQPSNHILTHPAIHMNHLHQTHLQEVVASGEQKLQEMKRQIKVFGEVTQANLSHNEQKTQEMQQIITASHNHIKHFGPAYAAITKDNAVILNQVRALQALFNKKAGKKAGPTAAKDEKTANDVLRLREEIKNKRLLIKGNISVIARVRPFNSDSDENKDLTYATVTDRTITLKAKPAKISAYDNNTKTVYDFKQVFKCTDENSMIKEIYDEVGYFVSALQAERDCLLFAFGQTGGGKTTLMEGRKEQIGIYECFLREFFSGRLKTSSDGVTLFDRVTLSALEIKPGSYCKPGGVKTNTFGRDMLNLSNKSKGYLTDDDKIAPYKKYKKAKLVTTTTARLELKEMELDSIDKFKVLFGSIRKNRLETETAANKSSSRSHLILHLNFYKKDKVTVLTLVDLAGYERDPGDDIAFAEMKSINNSLKRLKEAIESYNKITLNVTEKVFYSTAESGSNFESHLVRHLSPLLKAGRGRLAFVLALSIWNSNTAFLTYHGTDTDRHLSAAVESLGIASKFQEQKSVDLVDREKLQKELDAHIKAKYEQPNLEKGTEGMEPFVVKKLDRWFTNWTDPSTKPPLWLNQSISEFLDDIKQANLHTNEKMLIKVDGKSNELSYEEVMQTVQSAIDTVLDDNISAQVDEELFTLAYQKYKVTKESPVGVEFSDDETQSNQNFITFLTKTTNDEPVHHEDVIAAALGLPKDAYILRRMHIQTTVTQLNAMKASFKQKVTAVLDFFDVHKMGEIVGLTKVDNEELTKRVFRLSKLTPVDYKTHAKLLHIQGFFDAIEGIINKYPRDYIQEQYSQLLLDNPEALVVLDEETPSTGSQTTETLNSIQRSILALGKDMVNQQHSAMSSLTDEYTNRAKEQTALEQRYAEQSAEVLKLRVQLLEKSVGLSAQKASTPIKPRATSVAGNFVNANMTTKEKRRPSVDEDDDDQNFNMTTTISKVRPETQPSTSKKPRTKRNGTKVLGTMEIGSVQLDVYNDDTPNTTSLEEFCNDSSKATYGNMMHILQSKVVLEAVYGAYMQLDIMVVDSRYKTERQKRFKEILEQFNEFAKYIAVLVEIGSTTVDFDDMKADVDIPLTVEQKRLFGVTKTSSVMLEEICTTMYRMLNTSNEKPEVDDDMDDDDAPVNGTQMTLDTPSVIVPQQVRNPTPTIVPQSARRSAAPVNTHQVSFAAPVNHQPMRTPTPVHHLVNHTHAPVFSNPIDTTKDQLLAEAKKKIVQLEAELVKKNSLFQDEILRADERLKSKLAAVYAEGNALFTQAQQTFFESTIKNYEKAAAGQVDLINIISKSVFDCYNAIPIQDKPARTEVDVIQNISTVCTYIINTKTNGNAIIQAAGSRDASSWIHIIQQVTDLKTEKDNLQTSYTQLEAEVERVLGVWDLSFDKSPVSNTLSSAINLHLNKICQAGFEVRLILRNLLASDFESNLNVTGVRSPEVKKLSVDIYTRGRTLKQNAIDATNFSQYITSLYDIMPTAARTTITQTNSIPDAVHAISTYIKNKQVSITNYPASITTLQAALTQSRSETEHMNNVYQTYIDELFKLMVNANGCYNLDEKRKAIKTWIDEHHTTERSHGAPVTSSVDSTAVKALFDEMGYAYEKKTREHPTDVTHDYDSTSKNTNAYESDYNTNDSDSDSDFTEHDDDTPTSTVQHHYHLHQAQLYEKQQVNAALLAEKSELEADLVTLKLLNAHLRAQSATTHTRTNRRARVTITSQVE